MEPLRADPGIRAIAVGALMATGILSACSGGDLGFTTISADRFPPIGPTVTLSGVVDVRFNGCIHLQTGTEAPWVVWPPGAEQMSDAQGAAIRLADGTILRHDSPVDIEGEVMTRAGLPEGGDPDSMWGAYSGFCLGTEINNDREILRAATVTLR
ncbi:MAG: hypothetical protein ACK5LS_05870 [Propioniciclava sp.]